MQHPAAPRCYSRRGGGRMAATFEEFVVARGEALLRFALMLCGNRHGAEDLVQSALAKAYPRWSRIAAMERPEAYVKAALVNEHLSWWRRRSSRDAAWALLGRLPCRQRAVLVLRYYEDLADAEIATILGCAPATVRSQAARALATLRQALPAMDKEALP